MPTPTRDADFDAVQDLMKIMCAIRLQRVGASQVETYRIAIEVIVTLYLALDKEAAVEVFSSLLHRVRSKAIEGATVPEYDDKRLRIAIQALQDQHDLACSTPKGSA